MKKGVIIIIIILLLIGGFFSYKLIKGGIERAHIKEVKNGWYVEVTADEVKIRKEADRNTAELGKAIKGDVYKVDDMEINGNNYWYYVEYENGKKGWIGNPKNSNYLKDVNNPNDIASPTIKFFEDTYYVDRIEDINYDHLEVTDDKEGVVVTHKVFHELNELENKDQYWIQYTATDAVGKTTSKVQKIVFNHKPDKSEVYNFAELER